MRGAFIALLGAMLTGCSTPVSISLFPSKPLPPAPAFGGIKNFDIIDGENNAYRCAQPDIAGWNYLKSKGVQWDIMLDTDDEGSDTYAEIIGIHVIKIPIDFRHQMLGPIPISQILSAEKAHPKNIVIHCLHGQDRTGVAVFVYERNILGISKQAAVRDMLSHDFHKFLYALWLSVDRSH